MPQSLPIGTVRVWTHSVRTKTYQERYVKVSHHGPSNHRWLRYSQHVWQQTLGAIPPGFQIYHLDGNTLNDSLDNLVLVRSTERLKTVLQDRKSKRRRIRRQKKAVSKSNRRRGHLSSFRIRDNKFYAVVPGIRAVVWIPCRTRSEVIRRVSADLISQIVESMFEPTMASRNRLLAFTPGDPVEVFSGQEITQGSGDGGKFEGFVRLIPDSRRAPRKRQPRNATGST